MKHLLQMATRLYTSTCVLKLCLGICHTIMTYVSGILTLYCRLIFFRLLLVPCQAGEAYIALLQMLFISEGE